MDDAEKEMRAHVKRVKARVAKAKCATKIARLSLDRARTEALQIGRRLTVATKRKTKALERYNAARAKLREHPKSKGARCQLARTAAAWTDWQKRAGRLVDQHLAAARRVKAKGEIYDRSSREQTRAQQAWIDLPYRYREAARRRR